MNLRPVIKTAETSRKSGRQVLYVLLLVLIALYLFFSFLAGKTKKETDHPDIDTDALASSYIEVFSEFNAGTSQSEEGMTAQFSTN